MSVAGYGRPDATGLLTDQKGCFVPSVDGVHIYVKALPAGSCIVFDDRVMHRGLGNRSDSIRHMAYFSYREKGYAENTHFEAQRSVFDDREG